MARIEYRSITKKFVERGNKDLKREVESCKTLQNKKVKVIKSLMISSYVTVV